MNITTTHLAGVAVIDLERKEDDRGFFARTFDRKHFADAGLEPLVEQCNLSFNHKAGTLRGMPVAGTLLGGRWTHRAGI